MSNNIKLTILAVIAIGLSSCDDFLDRQPLDQITVENFYKNAEEVNLALVGSYAPMLDIDWTGKGWMITEIPSDNSQPGGTDPEFSPIDNFTVTADNPVIAAWWAKHYQQIGYANTILGKLESSTTIDDADRLAFDAEARFLRAVAYFDLVRIFGGVPLVTEPVEFGDELLLPRAEVDAIYELIKADFTAGAEHLPLTRSGAAAGRATRGAAGAFLAKVLLTRREFVAARDQALEVINSGVYSLMPHYEDLFQLATSDNNQESIFQVQYAGCGPFGTGNPMQAFFAPWGEGITKDRDGWGSQIPSSPIISTPNTTIVDAFEPGDLRKPVTVMTGGNYYPEINAGDGGYTYPNSGASAGAANIKKYVVGSGSNICFMSTPQNASVYRYADLLLVYAEAILENQGGVTVNQNALDAFNAVRVRAGLEPVDQISRESLLHERRVELAFEGQRWYDLVRSGRMVEIMSIHGKNPAEHNVLFPIPSAELQINPNLVQNPGYN